MTDEAKIKLIPEEDAKPYHQRARYTIEDAIQENGWGRFQKTVLFVCGLGLVSEAMESTVLSILSPAVHCEWAVTSTQQAFMTTFSYVGSLLGTFWGFLCDRYGRKRGVLLSFMMVFYYGFISAFSPSIYWLYALRAITGFSHMGSSQMGPLFVEFASTKSRSYSLLFGIFWDIGSVFAHVTAIVAMPTLGWRWQAAICSLPLLVISLLFYKLVPESIRYQVTRGYCDAASKTVQRMARVNGKPVPKGKLYTNKDYTSAETSFWQSWKLLLSPRLRRTTLSLWLINFATLFCNTGMGLVNTELMKTADGCPESSQTVGDYCKIGCPTLDAADYGRMLFISLNGFIAVGIAMSLQKALSRRKCMGFCYVTLGVLMTLMSVCVSKTYVMVLMLLIRVCISVSNLFLHLYALEVYPTSVRGAGVACCNSASRVGGIVTPFFAQVLLHISFYSTVASYSGVAIVAGLVALSLPIETKNRKMEDC